MSKRSKVHPKYKTRYRVTNWPEYDRALVRRGDLTIWFTPAALRTWTPLPTGQRGGQPRYSDPCVELALTLRNLFDPRNRRMLTPRGDGRRSDRVLRHQQACSITKRSELRLGYQRPYLTQDPNRLTPSFS